MESGVGAQLPQYQCHKKVWALKILAVDLIEKQVPHQVGEPTDKVITVDESGNCTIPSVAARLTVEDPFSPIEVDAEYVRCHKPVAGGYYVVYDTNYYSFSPAKAFEEGYTLIPPGMSVPKPCCLRFYSEQVAAATC